jgi:hypothetical protein
MEIASVPLSFPALRVFLAALSGLDRGEGFCVSQNFSSELLHPDDVLVKTRKILSKT